MPGGAPLNNNNAGRGREATAALEKALHQEAGEDSSQCIARFQAVVDIWKKQIKKAKEGDSTAATMILDRLEGKPAQSVNVAGPNGGPLEIEAYQLTETERSARIAALLDSARGRRTGEADNE